MLEYYFVSDVRVLKCDCIAKTRTASLACRIYCIKLTLANCKK